MDSRTFLFTAMAWLPAVTFTVAAEPAQAAEQAKIEQLITHVAGLGDAKFIRNGKEYDCKTAAKFLRGKWDANRDRIKTAGDFIAVAATRSSTSGKEYQIKLANGAPSSCAEYLKAQLQKLEKPAK